MTNALRMSQISMKVHFRYRLIVPDIVEELSIFPKTFTTLTMPHSHITCIHSEAQLALAAGTDNMPSAL